MWRNAEDSRKAADDVPVFLLALVAKGQRVDTPESRQRSGEEQSRRR
jgi:hypothetical protein